MQITDEAVREFQELWKKEYGVDLNDADARESAYNLLGFFETLMKVDTRIRRWNERLTNEPKGFPLPKNETYSCRICHQHMKGDEGWYDQCGMKCRPCQKAVEDGVIPGSVCTDRDSWVSSDDLKEKFGWHHATVAKKVRNGELRAREIRNGEYHWYFVFLKDENPSIL